VPSVFTGITVVIPTRNRSDIAAMAVASAAQVADVRTAIFVSDNSTDAVAACELEVFCTQLAAEPRGVEIVYARPDRDLPMGEHWEWARNSADEAFALSHVMYVTDRTILKPGAISRLGLIAAAHPERVISFNNDVIDDYQVPVLLRQEDWSGALVQVSAARLSELSASLILPRPLPRMLNVLVPTPVLDVVARGYGDVFVSIAPDFCFCFRHLSGGDDILYLDEALIVMHGLTRSNGNSTSRGIASEDTEDFLRHARDQGGLAAGTLLPEVTTTYNVIAQEYLAVAREFSDVMPRLNERAYLRALAVETDSFAPGAMKAANEAALEAAGVRFGWAAVAGRRVAHAVHYVRVLGMIDFLTLAWRRLRASSIAFETTDAGLSWAVSHPARQRSNLRHLRYLRPSTLVLRPSDAGNAPHGPSSARR
jgi:hypothetical protein